MKKINTILLVAALATFSVGFVNNSAQNTKEGTEVGNKAPDIKYKNPNGENMSLSSLKGQIVLIDFWASWCGPCRRENPNIVRAYNKYKEAKFKNGKGFSIFSVSLDNNKNAWIKAIQQDGLIWENHVSDLGGWQSAPAGRYGVNSIPASFLIDGKGIIIAKSIPGTPKLRGQDIFNELEKIVIKK